MNDKLYKIRFALAVIILAVSIIGVIGLAHSGKLTPLINYIMEHIAIITGVSLGILFIMTLIFGRIFCSLFCPLGVMQDIICAFREDTSEKRTNYPYKYIILAVTILLIIGGVFAFKYIEPYLFVTLSIITVITVIAAAVLAFFKGRLFCTDICPMGALFGLVSKISLLKIFINEEECLACGLCERNCPSWCIDSAEADVENITCVKCFKCMGKCSRNAIKYGIKK